MKVLALRASKIQRNEPDLDETGFLTNNVQGLGPLKTARFQELETVTFQGISNVFLKQKADYTSHNFYSICFPLIFNLTTICFKKCYILYYLMGKLL